MPPTAVPQVDAAEAARRLEGGQALLLDVREPDEWAGGHAPQAVHLALSAFDPASVPRDRPVVVVCRVGGRSQRAAEALQASGVDVVNLDGGMLAWAAQGLPVVREDGSAGEVLDH